MTLSSLRAQAPRVILSGLSLSNCIEKHWPSLRGGCMSQKLDVEVY